MTFGIVYILTEKRNAFSERLQLNFKLHNK